MISATQGVKLSSRCEDCGGELIRDVGQFIARGRLRWGVEGNCADCPNHWCEMGEGAAPEAIRQALVTAHGAVRLRLADPAANLVPVLRGLREKRPDLSLGEAHRLAAELKAAGLVGTLVETAYLAEGLRGRAVGVTVGPASG